MERRGRLLAGLVRDGVMTHEDVQRAVWEYGGGRTGRGAVS